MPLFQNRVFVQKLSDENEFHMHGNEPVGGTHDMNGSACRLNLKQKQKATRKFPITHVIKNATGQKQ